MRRRSALFAAALVAALACAPSLADARAGGGGSFGSRGGRTYLAPPSTSTAPSFTAPMERSLTPRSEPSAPFGTPYGAPAPAYRPGFGGGGFGRGLLGGLVGYGLGGLLFGHGFFGGGGIGFIGLLLQLLILFLIGRWVLRLVFGRGMPAFAGVPRMGQPAPLGASMGGGGFGARPAAGPPVTISQADYQAFAQLLQQVQAAWSTQDIGTLQRLATPEMVSYFAEQLAAQTSRGLHNTVTDVRLEKGDLAEAWSEGAREYATVAMRFSMNDVTRDSAGHVVDGAVGERTIATEIWTFLRAPGGQWLLSAIQQGR